MLAKIARAETPWTVEIGVFKDYLKEPDQKLIDKCFESDWNNKKVLKFKKSEEKDVKAEIYRVYHIYKETYKYFAGQDPTGNIFSIGMNTINQFMNEHLVCIDHDDKNAKLKPADADRMFITVNAGRSGPTNPANNLIRCQFMEYIMRCAIEKYFASG